MKKYLNSCYVSYVQAKHQEELEKRQKVAKEEDAKRRAENKRLRKEKYKLRKQMQTLNGSGSGGREFLRQGSYSEAYSQQNGLINEEEVVAWSNLMQSKLSLAYELICGLFDDVQTLHAQYSVGVPDPSDPHPQFLLDRYAGHLDRLYFELGSMQMPEGVFPSSVAEDLAGWEDDARQCCAVVHALKEVIFILSPVDIETPNCFEAFLYPVGNILSSLQMNDDGVPYELVCWSAGVDRSSAAVEFVKERVASEKKAKQATATSGSTVAGSVPLGLSLGQSPALKQGVPPFSPIRPVAINESNGGYVDGNLDDTEGGM